MIAYINHYISFHIKVMLLPLPLRYQNNWYFANYLEMSVGVETMIRKSIFLAITAMLMLALGIATQAQDADQSILEIAQDTEDLSTLVAAVEAADPAVAETLGDEGAYTVLAPSNEAFVNLAATLGVEVEDLLELPALTDILLYHVLDGEFFAEDITELDGEFALTLLDDNYVAVSVADDGTVTLNDIVIVTATDVDATNGVVHIIDNVLLPQSALENFGLASALNTNLQVLHFSPDAPNVDVYVDGELAIADLAFGENSGYVTLPAGSYEIAVAPTGTSINEAVLGPATFTFNAGQFVNIAAIGSVEAGTLTVTVFNQAFPLLEDNEISTTVFHAVEDAPAVDVVLNGDVALDALAYPFTDGTNDGAFNLWFETPVDSLTVNVAGEDTVLLDLSDAGLVAGNYYLVVVGGTLTEPTPYVFAIDAMRANELNDALYGEEDEMEDMEATEEASMSMGGSIADIVVASATAEDPEFTILLQAVQNADPAVLEALRGSDSLTVFAPTDEAFSNLLSVTGMTADDLLASDLLTDILLYHVVSGEVASSDVAGMDGEFVPTLLDGANIGVTVDDDGTILLNDLVGFVQTDIQADNGVIHVIDEVLLPQSALDALGL